MKTCHKHDYQSPTFTNKPCPECEEARVSIKLIAIHCTKCGILVGYRRYDVDILCVNCGQSLLRDGLK